MKKFQLLLIILFCSSVLLNAQFYEPVFPEKEGQDLMDNLIQSYKPSSVLGYGPARDTLYGSIYLNNDSVRCIYTGHAVYLPPGVDPSIALFMNGSNEGLNAEHTFPRSKGADEDNGNPYSDMHHIYPSKTPVNAARADYPFLEIPDNQTDVWYYLNQNLNSIPTSNIDLYSESINGAFEPREDHKGNVARAMFYFYTMYKQEADEADPVFFESQKETLCQWHDLDPVDSLEWTRTYMIATHQSGKPNPFVLDCSLPFRSYCTNISMECENQISTGTAKIENQIAGLNIYPNPAKGVGNIELNLNETALIELSVYNVLGQEIREIISAEYLAGEYTFMVNNINPGLYFCRLNIIHGNQNHTILKQIIFE